MTLVIDRIVGARVLAVLLAAALGWPWPALGQGAPTAQSAVPADQPLGPQELEQIVAPVALYPDPLLAQVFMASTYPLEVVEASRWTASTGTRPRASLRARSGRSSPRRSARATRPGAGPAGPGRITATITGCSRPRGRPRPAAPTAIWPTAT
jgi:Protein of unknown function (DUF3300)